LRIALLKSPAIAAAGLLAAVGAVVPAAAGGAEAGAAGATVDCCATTAPVADVPVTPSELGMLQAASPSAMINVSAVDAATRRQELFFARECVCIDVFMILFLCMSMKVHK
jgi:hypothetical protein